MRCQGGSSGLPLPITQANLLEPRNSVPQALSVCSEGIQVTGDRRSAVSVMQPLPPRNLGVGEGSGATAGWDADHGPFGTR